MLGELLAVGPVAGEAGARDGDPGIGAIHGRVDAWDGVKPERQRDAEHDRHGGGDRSGATIPLAARRQRPGG